MRQQRAWLSAMMFCLILPACSELPQEPTAIAVDSAQMLRERAAGRSSTLSEDDLTACGPGECTFDPASYQCGGQKVECSLQMEPITVTFSTSGRPTTLHVYGDPTARGALLCNGSMGTVRAYDESDVEVATAGLVPIEPEDCGADNITYGGETTINYPGGIDHIVIEPMSPDSFPVDGGTGVASAFYLVEYEIVTPPAFVVTCTASVQRGDSATCTVSKTHTSDTLSISGWTFRGAAVDEVVTRTQSVTSSTWSGIVVLPGTVTVVAMVNGTPDTVTSAPITVTPRSWSGLAATQYVIAEAIPSGLTIHPAKIDSQLGRSDLGISTVQGDPSILGVITDDGPNHDWSYYLKLPFRADMISRINREAMTLGSDFYNFQENQLRKIPGGGDRWYCPKPRVIDMVPYIEAHEGIDPSVHPDSSHSGIFVRVVDSLDRRWTEGVAGPEALFAQRSTDTTNAMRAFAKAVSDAMDNNPMLNNLHIQPDGDMTIFSPACQFKWMSGT